MSLSPPENSDDAFSVALDKISAGVDIVSKVTAPDDAYMEGIQALATEKAKAVVRNEWMLIELRKRYGNNIIGFLWVYFVVTMICVVASGFHILNFSLPEVVLASLVGGTAVSVLGVVGTVAAGLFRKPG